MVTPGSGMDVALDEPVHARDADRRQEGADRGEVRVTRRANRTAISFGVFCRVAPSTRAIIRSMKLCPGREVTRTTIASDSTVIPPVTPDRSPPDSLDTGADSPVTADSSTIAARSAGSAHVGAGIGTFLTSAHERCQAAVSVRLP
ncbi:hypothetical protein VR46_35990 [Streptomyces sp. NRRL S-444]|nr:hypothetical protein VR46_35990 [Streptomyces sp. NRRL S-444]